MEKNRIKSILWGLLSFAISFGSYLAFHIAFDWRREYGFIFAGPTALLYLILCLISYFVLKKMNISLARGFVWGLVAICIFLFTIGGCGLLRL